MGILRIIRHLFQRKEAYLPQLPAKQREVALPGRKAPWLCCGDFAETAKNHCHAVCVANLLRYLFPERKISFGEVHDIIGNGPIFTLRKLKKLCRCRQLPLITKKLRSADELQAALSCGEPCMILVANHLCDWHWILAMGFAESDGELFLRIVDGWHADCEHWYPVKKNSGWLSAYSTRKA